MTTCVAHKDPVIESTVVLIIGTSFPLIRGRSLVVMGAVSVPIELSLWIRLT